MLNKIIDVIMMYNIDLGNILELLGILKFVVLGEFLLVLLGLFDVICIFLVKGVVE